MFAVSTAQSFVWDPQTDPTVNTAAWTYLADLPVPPDLARAIKEALAQGGWVTERQRRFHEEELKMQFHFGGKAVAYLQTQRGRAIVVAGPPDGEEVFRVLDALPRSLRTKITFYPVDPWSDRFDPNAPTVV
jgi:hypothetical protein